MRVDIKELLFNQLTLYLSPFFWKQILTKQNVAFTDVDLPVFSTKRSRFEKK